MEDDGSDLLGISWHDSAWIPSLNPANIMDYFSRSKFYDRTCNNEVIKMQGQTIDRLVQMTGVEYRLVHVQQPILYIIRKQYRQSTEQVTPISHYYIIGGIVYQSPDLQTLISSRILNTVFNLNTALNKAVSSSRYHPSKGYWWDFKEQKPNEEAEKNKEAASWFQRQRVDLLLGELVKQYPMRVSASQSTEPTEKQEEKSDVKVGEKRHLEDSTSGQPDSKQPRIKTEDT